MPTIKDIADYAQVSTCTVSRYLNQTSNLKPKTVAKIESAIKELGYIPNVVAKSLKTHKTKNIAVIIPTINSLFYSEIISGIGEVLDRDGYNLFTYETAHSKRKETDILHTMLENMMAGVIFMAPSYDFSFKDSLQLLLDYGIPVVYINREMAYTNFPLVFPNFEDVGILAAEHLTGLGRNKLAVVNKGPRSLSSYPHVKSFCERAAQLGVQTVLEVFEPGQPYMIPGKDFIEKLLRKQINGIFAINELVALGMLKSLVLAKVQIPGDISLIGLGNSPFEELVVPELTSIDLRNYEMGVKSAQLLLRQIHNQDFEQVIKIEPAIVNRAST